MQDINENVVMAVHFMSSLSVYSVSFGLLAKALLTVSGYKTALGSHTVPFLQGFTSCILLASAGTNTVALLRGESIGVLKNTPLWLSFGVVYTMVFYNKTVAGSIQKAMASPYFKTVFMALACMDRGNTMIWYGVDGVTGGLGPDVIIAKLVCGTLAGCASELWSEMLGLRQSQWTFRAPSVFFKFGAEMRISFITVVTYLLLLFAFDSKIAHAWSVLFFTIANVSLFISTSFSKKIKNKFAFYPTLDLPDNIHKLVLITKDETDNVYDKLIQKKDVKKEIHAGFDCEWIKTNSIYFGTDFL